MTDLLDWSPPDGVEVLQVWLAPLGECRSERPTGAVLPFVTVRRTAGGGDDLVDRGRYSVSVFHETEAKAAEFGRLVHRRIKLLAGQFTGPRPVTLDDDSVVHVDNVITIEAFRPEAYAAEPTVRRVRAIYEAHLRVAA